MNPRETTSDMSLNCRSEDVAAFLDGELDQAAVERFEAHVKDCRSCAEELREQRRLLCALNFAFGDDEPALALPTNFARVVATNAETDMGGLRHRAEHKRALRICAVLLLLSFALLGGARFSEQVLSPVSTVAKYSESVLGLVWRVVSDTGAGVTVILRAIVRRFIFESHPLSLLAFLLFAFALALLSHLLVRYHRTQTAE